MWRVFVGVNGRRRGGFSGPEPLAEAEIEAWAARRHVSLSVQDWGALDALDGAFLRWWHEERPGKDKEAAAAATVAPPGALPPGPDRAEVAAKLRGTIEAIGEKIGGVRAITAAEHAAMIAEARAAGAPEGIG